MADQASDTPATMSTPIQPTGYGVADLAIAREQDALADDGELTGAVEEETDVVDEPSSPSDPSWAGSTGEGPRADPASESEAHPS